MLAPLMMTIPFTAFGLTYVDALFGAVSGVTTTGLSTLGTLANTLRTFLFDRAWMQWYGGVGASWCCPSRC